jgi:hypothetical protein
MSNLCCCCPRAGAHRLGRPVKCLGAARARKGRIGRAASKLSGCCGALINVAGVPAGCRFSQLWLCALQQALQQCASGVRCVPGPNGPQLSFDLYQRIFARKSLVSTGPLKCTMEWGEVGHCGNRICSGMWFTCNIGFCQAAEVGEGSAVLRL